MRYLHPVQAHERFVASGCYHFRKDGQALKKTEAWSLHALPDGEIFLRADKDAQREEGRSILLEALLDRGGQLARLDIRYENESFPGGIRELRATYQLREGGLHIGYSMNGAERAYTETELPPRALIDIPLLVFRGGTIIALAAAGPAPLPLFVPMFEQAALFPGRLATVYSPVEYVGDDKLRLGQRIIPTRMYRYRNTALLYWIDAAGIVIKRRQAFQGSEILVEISNYAAPRGRALGPC